MTAIDPADPRWDDYAASLRALGWTYDQVACALAERGTPDRDEDFALFLTRTAVPKIDAVGAVDTMLAALLPDPETCERCGSRLVAGEGDADYCGPCTEIAADELEAELAGPNPDDPPSPAADMLDALLQDAPEVFPDLKFSDIHDTNPGGIGEAAIHVADPLGHRYLLVAVPVEQMGALDNRSYVRRLLAEKRPRLAEAIAATERILDAELTA